MRMLTLLCNYFCRNKSDLFIIGIKPAFISVLTLVSLNRDNVFKICVSVIPTCFQGNAVLIFVFSFKLEAERVGKKRFQGGKVTT